MRCTQCKCIYKPYGKSQADVNKKNFHCHKPRLCFECEINVGWQCEVTYWCDACSQVITVTKKRDQKLRPNEKCRECTKSSCKNCYSFCASKELILYREFKYCDQCIQVIAKCDECKQTVKKKSQLHYLSGQFYCDSCYYQSCHYCSQVTTREIMSFFGHFSCLNCLGNICKHSHSECMMTKTHCCVCQDKRPNSDGYSGYIDAVGFVENMKREDFYCSTCKSNIRAGKTIEVKSAKVTTHESGLCPASSSNEITPKY
jgi:hypothetical protein